MSAHTTVFDRLKGGEVVTIPALEDNYIYALVWGNSAAVIDPADATAVLRALRHRNCKLSHILVTHHHLDHVAGNVELKKATGCRVIGPNDPRIPALDEQVADGEVVDVGPYALKVIATPGHSHTHIAYHDSAKGLLWTGDTLFAAGCGRLFDCPAELMWNSLQKLAALPDETQFFCGHEYTVDNLRFAAEMEPKNADIRDRLAAVTALRNEKQPTVPSNIGLEKKTNPFLRVRSPELRATLNMAGATDLSVFTELRRRKDSFQ